MSVSSGKNELQGYDAIRMGGEWFNHALVGSAKTLANTDCGILQVCDQDCTITLPATIVGLNYTILNTRQGSAVTISPNSSDLIRGLSSDGADNKDLLLASANAGDYVKLISDGAVGWWAVEGKGTFTRES